MYIREQVVDAIENCLDEGERKIIRTRFGIDDGIPKTLIEIEVRFGVDREQVREIEKKVRTYLKEHC
ncbi:sigma factor-like helix-turn-helix DNA-binding protein [Desulfosporosinus sp.]|uniref:sigma factor-like helix-turn-helix DNA-binding protein n=1 Tax=Desulfosporosinus sp. TaxID=157907 RepID=UPI0025C42051|nr:sigma factor-like helix-turn-helix DNA-binding protein [Desulfosporosinus sp.]MBC2724710.1 hypothetical protein [Desulfosporosinus sp.]MBC2725443.1 hypothetical protein [Desulfosporosinus sp.]